MNLPPRAVVGRRSWAALLAVAALVAHASDATRERLPPALRGADPRRISSGVYRALVGSRPAAGAAPKAANAPPAAGLAPFSDLKATPPALLDARVSPNLRLGADPSQLPAGEINQAEPFIFRSAANADLVLAIVQEGRFGGGEGGSADGGYALSTDGGFTWTRSLIPGLSQVTGGVYFRSTDPVSAIDLQGNLFLSTLDARDSAFTQDDLVVSRSTDGGATWTQHVAYSTPNAQIFADKDWMAVNDYAGTPHVGRLVATFTGFAVDAQGNTTTSTLFALLSDDQGETWTPTIAITPSAGNFQGTQPYFLPDGTLICVYQSYSSTVSNVFAIECSRSADGGNSWAPAVVVAPGQIEYDDPVARTGGGLPGVVVARHAGTVYATWQSAAPNGSGRILVSRSTDGGMTWGAPVVVSDNPSGDSVFNPGITATPDGSVVTAVFYDKRLGPDTQHYVDLFATQSFDGGQTWSPEFRASDYTTDLRLTVLSDTGYMLGDYLGIAPALTPTQGTVPIWCDTRYGNSDPFIARIAPVATATFAAWQSVRFSRAQLANPGLSGPAADPDGDGYGNLAEYALGSDPLAAESGGVLAVTGVTPGAGATSVGLAWSERSTSDFTAALQLSRDGGATWGAAPVPVTATPNGASTAAAATLSLPSSGATLVRLAFAQASGPTVSAPDTIVVNGASALANLSSRGPVGSGASQLIAGFVTKGSATAVLARAAGPGLAAFGVAGFLTDPVLTLQTTSNAAVVASNDNWGDGGSAQTIATLAGSLGAFPFASGSLDSALVTTLPGGDYSATVTGAPGATGSVALVELYDAGSGPSGGRLVNVSTRGAVGTGANVMIAGFVISGPQPKRVLLRAIGPALAPFGVSGTLADPQLAVFDASGKQIAANDDWSVSRSMATTAATQTRVGAFALTEGSPDSALVLTLAPGAYTVQVSGVAAGTGNALVEIYDAD